MTGAAREAQRQQLLLRALLGDDPPEVLARWLRESTTAAGLDRGLAAYRSNAGAHAERALAAAYPTLVQLLGHEAFAALASAFWQQQPAAAGDLGLWGAELCSFIAGIESWRSEPYLPDVARLEWAVRLAERAADAAPPQGLERLADCEPETLFLHLSPGTTLVDSAHPVVTLLLAHRSAAADRFAPVRAAIQAGAAECALVERQGWRAVPRSLPPDEARFARAVLAGRSLADALDAAGAAFDFQAWLIAVLQRGGLAAVDTCPPQTPPPTLPQTAP